MYRGSSFCRRTRTFRLLVFAACAAFAAPVAARAQGWTGGLDLAVASDDYRWALVPTARAAYRLNRRWTTRAEWGCVETSFPSEGEHGWSRFETGNLFFGVDAQGGTDAIGWRFGAGATAPTARLDGVHDPHGRTALGDAASTQALWDLWLWAPDRLGIVVPAGVGLEGDGYRLDLEAAAALLVPARQTVGLGTDMLVQTRAVAAVQSLDFEGGAMLQGVVMATQPSDRLQLAAAPFARLRFGAFWLGLRYLYPITTPLADRTSIHLELGLGGLDAR